MKQVKPLAPLSDEPTAPTEESTFGDILSEYEQSHPGVDDKASDMPTGTLEGSVVTVSGDQVFVDIGRKTEGLIPLAKLRELAPERDIEPGTRLLVTVTGRNEEGYYELSTLHIEQPKDWTGLEAAFTEGRVITGTVVEPIKGGLRVDVGVRAFMPASRSGAKDVPEMEKLVGQQIQCKIIKLDIPTEDVVVDRRAVLAEQEKEARQQRFGEVKEGDVLTGTVRSVTDFGAFLELGGVDGLLHVTDMAWTRVGKPSDIVKTGDRLEVKVLKVNPETRKISLGRKQLIPDPWTVAAEKYPIGARVQGKVSRLADFGAFVELEPGVDGLIHVSEMSWSKKVRKPSDVVQVGELVDVAVLGVNPSDRRIALGLKQALGDPWEQAPEKFPIGSVVEGAVVSLTKFGAFVDLGEGFEGMIHIADITRAKRLEHPNEVLKSAQVVKAQVLEVDRERRRIRLGMKQLEPTSLDEYIAEHQPGETVSGRILEVTPSKYRVELGEGVVAQCKLQAEAGTEKAAVAEPVRGGDLSSLTAMLSARWKSGGVGGGSGEPSSTPKQQSARPGQVRSFRIVTLSAEQKRIDVELVS